MRTSSIVLIASAALFAAVTCPAIQIDGQFADWTNAVTYEIPQESRDAAGSPYGRVERLQVSGDEVFLYFRIEFSEPRPFDPATETAEVAARRALWLGRRRTAGGEQARQCRGGQQRPQGWWHRHRIPSPGGRPHLGRGWLPAASQRGHRSRTTQPWAVVAGASTAASATRSGDSPAAQAAAIAARRSRVARV